MLFGDERVTPAVLTFLRETKVGDFAALAALEGERMVDVEPREEGKERGAGEAP